MPVAIAGMHRAGTSMVARALRLCGLDVGDEAHFAPPAPDNTEGYWEDLRFVGWNERLLAAFGGAWDVVPERPAGWEDDPRLAPIRTEVADLAATRAEPWGFKDPRTSVAAPFWMACLPGLVFVVCVRHPLEVAASLRARGYTSERYGLRLWEAYHRALDAAVPAERAVVTHYDSYFADPAAELDRVLRFLGLDPPESLRVAAIASASAGARHQRRGTRDLDASGADASVRRMYESLCARSGPVLARVPPPSASPGPAVAPAGGPTPATGAAAEAELLALVAAREEELAVLKPLLAAREAEVDGLTLELASVESVRAARDEELGAIRPVLAAREAEIAGFHAELEALRGIVASRDEELASVKFVLSARDEELQAVKALLEAYESRLEPKDRLR
jgi:hypothetical protein